MCARVHRAAPTSSDCALENSDELLCGHRTCWILKKDKKRKKGVKSQSRSKKIRLPHAAIGCQQAEVDGVLSVLFILLTTK